MVYSTNKHNKTHHKNSSKLIKFVPQDKKDLNRKRTYRHKLSGIYIYIYTYRQLNLFSRFRYC